MSIPSTIVLLVGVGLAIASSPAFSTLAGADGCPGLWEDISEPTGTRSFTSNSVSSGAAYYHKVAAPATYTVTPSPNAQVGLYVYPNASNCSAGAAACAMWYGAPGQAQTCSVSWGSNMWVEIYVSPVGATATLSFAGTPICQQPAPGITQCVEPGRVALNKTLYAVNTTNGTSHHVAGYVDAYRFPIPTGGNAIVPCVTLVADGTTTDPCDGAGTFVERRSTLVDEPLSELQAEQGEPVKSIQVCEAQVTILVEGFGVESQPAYVLC